MTEIPTEDEFMSMIRRHEVAACEVKKDDTRTHETTLAALTQAKRDLLYAFDAQAARIAKLEAQLRHIIRWCEQDISMMQELHILSAVTRMCRDVLPKEATNESES